MPVTSEPEAAAVVQPETRAESAVTSWSRLDSVAALAITIVAAALRLYHLGTRSLWFDEGFSAGIALMRWPDFLRTNSAYSANMAFYYLLLKLWLPLGNSDAWTRGLSALLGIACIPALYWLARKQFGSTAAIGAALLLATNAFHVKYSQEARAYSLVVLLVIVSAILLLRAIERETTRAWLGWSLVAALAVYAHTYAVLVIGAEVMWAWFAAPEQRRSLFSAWRWMVLALVPYLVIMFRGGAGAIGWLRPFTLHDLAQTVVQVCGNAGWILPSLLAAGCAGAFWLKGDGRRQFTLAALWAILPFVAVTIMSRFKPLLYPRYMIVCLPGIALMAAAAAARLPRWLTALWLVATAGVSLWASGLYYQRELLPPDDWRATTRYVLSQRSPNDLLVFYTWQGTLAFHYYWWQADHSAPTANPDDLRYANIAELVQDQPESQHVWVLLDHFGGTDPSEIWVRGWFSRKYNKVSEKDFRGMTIIEYRHKP
jgi:mannosyltransferase